MKKRVLSALLVLCMACSMVSTVWATETNATSGAPEPASQVITVDPVEATVATGENAATPAPGEDEESEPPEETPAATEEPVAEEDPDDSPAPSQEPESLQPNRVAAADAALSLQARAWLDSHKGLDTSDIIDITLFDYSVLDDDADEHWSSNKDDGINEHGDTPFDFVGDGGEVDSHGMLNTWTSTSAQGDNPGQPGGVLQGIVADELSNGYPRLDWSYTSGGWKYTDTDSLAYLFNDDEYQNWNGQKYKKVYDSVNYLLQKDGDTYYYDSSENFATLKRESGQNNIYLYDVARGDGTGVPADLAQFLPFNDLNGNSTSKGTYTEYGISGSANYHFGMTVGFDFIMPRDGKVNGQEMVFEFEGDDDVWVFIDGKLVLDMGGIHDNYGGSINFATGEVKVERVNIGSPGDSTVNESQTTKDLWDLLGTTKDEFTYDTHRLEFFYLERGAGGSNCKLSFNLPAIPSNSLNVTKEVTANNEAAEYLLGNYEYKFQVVAAEDYTSADGTHIGSAGELLIREGDTYDIYDKNNNLVKANVTVGENGVFTLQNGQRAVFTGKVDASGNKTPYWFLADNEEVKFLVRELLEDDYTEQYGDVIASISGQGGRVQGEHLEESDFTAYESGTMTGSDGNTFVVFQNEIDAEKLSALYITKELAPGTQVGPDEDFTVQITVNGEFLPRNSSYSIEGDTEKTYTVNSDNGTISLKPGQTIILIDKMVAGTNYTVKELYADNYTVTYAGVAKKNGQELTGEHFQVTDAGIEGNILETGSNHYVTITNADYDFYTSLPIQKTLEGYEQSEYTFNFQVEQVDQSGNEQTAQDGVIPAGAEIVVNSVNAADGTVYFGFKSTVPNDNYYFKLSEEQGTVDGVTYDDSYYLVTVKVENGTATVTDVKKYNDNEVDESYRWNNGDNVPSFTNSLGKDLTIIKVVKGVSDQDVVEDKTFTFTLQGPAAVAGKSYTQEGTDKKITFTEGDKPTATVSVTGAGSVTIKGLPDGVYSVISESGTNDWNADVDGKYLSTPDYGQAVTLESGTNKATITVTNTYKDYKSLTIEKSVTGGMATDSDQFTFTVKKTTGTLSNGDVVETATEDEKVININYDAGTTTIVMTAGGKVTLNNLKDTDVIEIAETEPGSGYDLKEITLPTQEINGEEKDALGFVKSQAKVTVTMTNVTLTDDELGNINFLNERKVVAPTGLESNHTTPYVLMITAAGMAGLALIGGIVARRVRRRRQE